MDAIKYYLDMFRDLFHKEEQEKRKELRKGGLGATTPKGHSRKGSRILRGEKK